MRVLIVKTSSMGDLIHTLPAVTDAAAAIAGIRFDWVAEGAFAEIPAWHPAVDRVITVALRKWRKNPLSGAVRRDMGTAVRALRAQRYDSVIDAQGLIKSAVLTRLSRGRRCGMDRASCREPLASLAYQERFAVPRGLHAIDRVRLLFSEVLGYPFDATALQYGLHRDTFEAPPDPRPYVVFLHGASRASKLWPKANWQALAARAAEAGYAVLLPWGNAAEKRRAEAIAKGAAGAKVLPRLPLTALAGVLAHAAGVVGVDTGLAHLAAALAVPGVTLYLTTDPKLTGARGTLQTCLARRDGRSAGGAIEAACPGLETLFLEDLSADAVWCQLGKKMNPRPLKDSIIIAS